MAYLMPINPKEGSLYSTHLQPLPEKGTLMDCKRILLAVAATATIVIPFGVDDQQISRNPNLSNGTLNVALE